ncbi:hypothetical protein C942_00687 [Photobacterium marinum]|uniref:DUF4194 domain-containing protein n=1 Tax=Photobacterium marinum TaxID=1056511 RepID=L8JDJ4_9GAMM|nr:DUF4194 domain-containing protein [Photobacterium marinum]ELR65604.1 hypothetical protein C942_00687 [Photobacterium marinum]
MASEIILRELKDIELKKSADYIDSLRKTSAYLIRNQWVWNEKRGHKEHFKRCEENQTYFHKLFDSLDMTWHFDRNFGYAGVLPRGAGKRLDVTTTLFLLILRKMYDTEASMGRTELGRVKPPATELINQYELIRGDRPPVTETSYALENLKRKGVIELGERDGDTKLYEITVLPNITRVVSAAYLGVLEQFMDSYSDAVLKEDSAECDEAMEMSND